MEKYDKYLAIFMAAYMIFMFLLASISGYLVRNSLDILVPRYGRQVQ